MMTKVTKLITISVGIMINARQRVLKHRLEPDSFEPERVGTVDPKNAPGPSCRTLLGNVHQRRARDHGCGTPETTPMVNCCSACSSSIACQARSRLAARRLRHDL